MGEVGIVFGSLTPPEELARGAGLAEGLGFEEVWFSEDLFFTGGASGVTQLLASTRDIPAGLGLASVMTRHPAILAIELAGVARMYPGRLRATVGLGNRGWLEQLGLVPDRPLTAVAETFDALRRLLAGDEVTGTYGGHRYDGVQLAFPPDIVPELWIGAVGERALRLAGARADGVLLSVLSGPSYVEWARAQIERGAREAGRTPPRVTAFALAAVDDDAGKAKDAVRGAVEFFVDAERHTALVQQARHPEEFAIAGTPTDAKAQLQRLFDAGVDSVGLWLFPADSHADVMRRFAQEVR